ncbi:MAG: hypothetical protein NTW42_09570 [Deltaproteobacteria bacterium]|nr:hypothetical protein [Deltaproteobacteria bacterium]
MRITMRSIHSNILTNLNNLTTDMARINAQISSGRQMSTISDNPVNLVTALGLRSSLSQITTYQDNLKFGDKTITAAEDSLTQMKGIALRAKVLGLQQANGSVTPQNRASAAEEVHNLWLEAITLANSEVNGKYVFGGFRTTGYTKTEPEPFVADLGSGYSVNGKNLASMNATLTGTVDNTPPANLLAGDVRINGADLGAVTLNVAATNGLNMGGAFNLAAKVNGTPTISPPTSASLTTLTYSSAATTAAVATGTITMTLNGAPITVPVTLGDSIATVNAAFAAAVNATTGQTGVVATVGNGSNGAANNTLILQNAQAGDGAAINVTAFNAGGTGTGINLAVGAQSADATHNTGQISLSSTSSFTITTSTANDTILNRIGLGGGNKGFADVAGDGTLRYDSALAAGDLTINGTPIAATTTDGLSTIYATASAAAKAKAINDLAGTTGVTANITPAFLSAAGGAVTAGALGVGDLKINGQDIFAAPTAILAQDTDNTLANAINAKSGLTGVVASRDSSGVLSLTATDGRNIQITTTANGEAVSHLNGGVVAANKAYFGTVQLSSNRPFSLQTAAGAEPGLDALGLDGGTPATNEVNDIAGDGLLTVITIQKKDGNVRYAGDPDHDLAIKVGGKSTMEVSKNGKAAVSDTDIFNMLKKLEDSLLGQNFNSVTGLNKATNTAAKLNSGSTGLEQQNKPFTPGIIAITVTDHSYSPPQNTTRDVGVDIAADSPADIAARINGIPGMTASWDANGQLTLATTDSARYSFAYTDTSNFLEMSGITTDAMQVQAISQASGNADTVMDNLSTQISDFGARANRIIVQQQIYSNLELSTTANLSEKQDTDLTKALLELKGKETAYQAALSAAAKTMQLSLLDYLK